MVHNMLKLNENLNLMSADTLSVMLKGQLKGASKYFIIFTTALFKYPKISLLMCGAHRQTSSSNRWSYHAENELKRSRKWFVLARPT